MTSTISKHDVAIRGTDALYRDMKIGDVMECAEGLVFIPHADDFGDDELDALDADTREELLDRLAGEADRLADVLDARVTRWLAPFADTLDEAIEDELSKGVSA